MNAIEAQQRLFDIFDVLRSQGFTPEEHGPTEWEQDWFMLRIGRDQAVRVVLYPDDGGRAEIYRLAERTSTSGRRTWWDEQWGMALSGTTPPRVIAGLIREAIDN